jgi:hypothetical protein
MSQEFVDPTTGETSEDQYDEWGNLIEQPAVDEGTGEPAQAPPAAPAPPAPQQAPQPQARQDQPQQPQPEQRTQQPYQPPAPVQYITDDEKRAIADELITNPEAAIDRFVNMQVQIQQRFERTRAQEDFYRAENDDQRMAARERVLLANLAPEHRGNQQAAQWARKAAIAAEIAESDDPVSAMEKQLARLKAARGDAPAEPPAPADTRVRNADGTFAPAAAPAVVPPAQRMPGAGSVNPRGAATRAVPAGRTQGNGSALNDLEKMYGIPAGSIPDREG